MQPETNSADADALRLAVAAYDSARCAIHGANERPMSERNRETIAPMIRAAIDAYLAALRSRPDSEPAPVEARAERVWVERVECVNWSKGYAEPADPHWRIEIDGYCAEFETPDAASNFAAAINRLARHPTLREHVEKGDPVDVGNLPMMIQQRGETTPAQPAPTQGDLEPVAWRERDDGWKYYDRDSNPRLFDHITKHQKSWHGVSIFPLYASAQSPPSVAAKDAEIARLRSALKPFAAIYRVFYAEEPDDMPISLGRWAEMIPNKPARFYADARCTVAHFRKIDAALSAEQGGRADG